MPLSAPLATSASSAAPSSTGSLDFFSFSTQLTAGEERERREGREEEDDRRGGERRQEMETKGGTKDRVEEGMEKFKRKKMRIESRAKKKKGE